MRARFGALVVGTLTAGLLGAVVTVPAADAASSVQEGVVGFVPDGDTIDVKIDGVAADPGRKGTRIRFVGIQATEMHTYKVDLSQAEGECYAKAATARLREILGGARNDYAHRETDGARVRLTARDSRSQSRGRQQRIVWVKDSSGDWQDVGEMMLREGLVLPVYNAVEFTHNHAYRVAALAARAEGLGMWNPNACGTRPAASAKLAVSVNWDAPGNDARNLNGEYFRVKNVGTAAVSLRGWWLRDSSLRDFFHFPAGAALEPGRTLYVHVGKGKANVSTNGSRHYYWGQTTPAFENVTGSPTWMGDGGYLFDTQGNLRASYLYGKV